MELDQAREIAERIARRMSSESPSTPNPAQPKAQVSAELAAVRDGLSELQRKIAQLEARVSSDSSQPRSATTDYAFDEHTPGYEPRTSQRPVMLTHSPWLAGVNASFSHPSQEKFGVEEAVVSELVNHFEKEKICSIEPGGKPCDHCAMCNTRGF